MTKSSLVSYSRDQDLPIIMRSAETRFGRPQLPRPEKIAYFPQITSEPVHDWKNWAKEKVGEDNLVFAFGYGSHVTGNPSPTSRHDFFLVVKDVKEFHQKNMDSYPDDYGKPRLARWHTFINRGPSYYYTTVQNDEGEETRLKYVIISEDNFVKGSHGSLPRRQREEPGGFGLSVAGRIQKVALDPIYISKERATREKIETAINKARIDGVWLALGTLEKQFSTNELLKEYVSLSYRFDWRPGYEKKDKAEIIINRNPKDYEAMLSPIFDAYQEACILAPVEHDGEIQWTKHKSPTKGEIFRRELVMRVRTTARNLIKTGATVGYFNGGKYLKEKHSRAKN